MLWSSLVQLPIEWASLALFVVACLYWERSGFSGLGVEGAIATAMIGLILGWHWTGNYGLACLIAASGAAAFGITTGALVQLLRADSAVGAFTLSLIPACGLSLILRAGPLRIVEETPAPGLVRGTAFAGTVAENLLANPWMWAAPLVIAFASWLLWHTSFGLRLRAFGENPGWRVPGSSPTAYRLGALAVGALWAVPGAALLLRAHPDAPPIGLGCIALACVIGGRWSLRFGILLAAGPALLRAASPYGAGLPDGTIVLDIAPFLLALLYLVVLSRRALRLASSVQSRLDPDVL